MEGKGKKRQLKRRHHTVPQMYLRRFADEDEQFVRVPLGGGEKRSMAVVHATVLKDFYSSRNADGELDDSMEDRLDKDFEAPAAEVLREVVEADRWPLSAEHRTTLARWTAAQLVRGPADRMVMTEAHDQLVKMLIGMGGKPELRRHLEKIEGRPVSEAEVEEMWAVMADFDDYVVDLPVTEHLDSMLHRIETVVPLLLHRSWALVRFARRALLTSDHPVALAAAPGTTAHNGVGVANAEAVVLPIDRRAAILMYAPGPDFRLPGTTQLARFINQQVAWNARSAVFHHPDDNPLDKIELPPQRTQELGFSQTPGELTFPDAFPSPS